MQSQHEGQQIGRYIVRQRLGGGGVATVYQAYDQVSGQSVALKVLPPNPDPATLNRFKREALMAGALRHPNIVRILQVGTVGDGPAAYIAMDLVEGESLAALLARFGQLRPEESCLLLEPIARALAFAHRQGVIHRDVKPSNILLRPVGLRVTAPDGADAATVALATSPDVTLELLEHSVVPLLSDFGIARFMDAPELTNAGRTVGTPAFMAPEQCMGSREVDGRADIYSLGTVLYRCVVGRLPFNGSTTQILHAHVFEPVVIEDEMLRLLPPKVVEILRRTLAKAPEDRYQEADMLADELAAVGATIKNAALATNGSADEATATATITLANVAAVAQPEPSAMQILVPGTTSVESVATSAKPKTVSVRKRGPSLERILWAGFYLFLIVGGGYYAARTWFRDPQQQQTGRQSVMPPVFLVTNTPTVASGDSLNAQLVMSTTPMPEGAGVHLLATPVMTTVVSTDVVSTSVLSTTVSTGTLLIDTPTPAATLVPTVVPTQVPVVVEESVPTAMPTLTPIVEVTPEETVGVCAAVVDDFFLRFVGELSGELSADFACPKGPATVAQGEWMPFEKGTMVAVEGSSLVYVFYVDGTWEQVEKGNGSSPTENSKVSELPAPFGEIAAAQGRYLLLGNPILTEPLRGETLIQPFNGGMLIGRLGYETVLPLARSTLRF